MDYRAFEGLSLKMAGKVFFCVNKPIFSYKVAYHLFSFRVSFIFRYYELVNVIDGVMELLIKEAVGFKNVGVLCWISNKGL